MPALFDTYSSDYSLVRVANGRPILIPSSNQEAINKTCAIVHRDLQIINFLRTKVKSIFEIGCDAGHLIGLSEYYGIVSFGVDIDKTAIKSCLSNGINASYADMTILIDPSSRSPYYERLHNLAIQHELIAFLNFSHVDWHKESVHKRRLFSYATNNFKYILCSMYDNQVQQFEQIYGTRLLHSFSNWRTQFNREDNISVQYQNKFSTCCLETYVNLQKLFIVDADIG